MIRSAIAVVLLFGAVLWLPWWVQLVLLAAATLFVPYRLVLFIPAAFADALYAPGGVSVMNMKYTLMTAVLLILYWAIMTQTRVGELYAVEKK